MGAEMIRLHLMLKADGKASMVSVRKKLIMEVEFF